MLGDQTTLDGANFEDRITALEQSLTAPIGLEQLPMQQLLDFFASDPSSVFQGSEVLQTASVSPQLLAPAPFVEVRKTATQAVASGGNVLLTWDTETLDLQFMHNPADSKLTAPIDGVYAIVCTVPWDTAAPGAASYRELTLITNGSTAPVDRIGGHGVAVPAGIISPIHCVAAMHFMKAGEYVQAQVFQNTGASQNILAATIQAKFSMRWIGN